MDMQFKLRAPGVSDAIPRSRKVLEAIVRHKLSLIIAGPGYGKTVLAAQAARLPGIELVWMRSDATADTLPGFLRGLAQGITSFYPDFKLPAVKETGPDRPSRVAVDAASLAGRFLDAMENHITRDFFLVLDDCHYLDDIPDILVFLQMFMDRFLPRFHLILVGRSVPKLKVSRLMASRQVLRIMESELAFSSKDVGRLFSLIFNIYLSREDMALLLYKTKGWATGLILFAQSLGMHSRSQITDAISRLKGSHKLINDYLKENLYDLLCDDEKMFLLKTAILTKMDTSFCDRFLGRTDTRQMLCSFEDRHCFVFSSNEDRNRFSYHPLFREFLIDRIRFDLAQTQSGQLFAKAAALYEKTDQGQEALIHHIQAGNIADASRLLNRFARPIIKQDRPHMLKSLLSVIPVQYMDDEPWFQYLQAGYYSICSQLQMAVTAYEKVLKSFRSQKDEQGECLVLMELAEYYLSAGALRQAEQAYIKILGKDKLDAYLTVIVMGYLIRVLALAGRSSDADRYARKAMDLLEYLDNDTDLCMGRAWIYVAQGFRYAFSGGYEKAMALGEDAKSLFLSIEEDRFLFSAYFLISFSCYYLGRFEKGKASAKEGLQLAKEKGVNDEFSHFLLLLKAKNSLEIQDMTMADIDQALVDSKQSLSFFESCSFPEGIAQGYLVRHRAYIRKGDIRLAEQSLRKGIEAIRESDMPLVKNELHVSLSRFLLFDREDVQKREAFILLKAAEQELLYSGWHMSCVSRIFARYYWEYGHKESTFKYMVYALKIAEEESFDAWIIWEREWIIPILVAMFAQGSMKSYISNLFRQMEADALHKLSIIKAKANPQTKKAISQLADLIPKPDPLPLKVFFFGRFRLFVGEREILPENWKSRKALTLFKYMVVNGQQGFLDRDLLMELAWPDEDPKKSAQRFHVAMASIRKTLEPDIGKGVRSSYIQRSGQAYRISVGTNGQVDIRTFMEKVTQAQNENDPKAATDLYKQSSVLYKGAFLKEDPYEEWCIKIREEYERNYLGVLLQIMEFYEMKKNYSQCISIARNYLIRDRYAEQVLRKLMEYHAKTGNTLMVSRLYKTFKQEIKEELDCQVSDETKTLYFRLVSGG
ncbi:MAG: hypothetical protein MI892_00760 [Desulfobacterales bacterium]|nr:hypothetical protein [Desulfobacterales bacterium]